MQSAARSAQGAMCTPPGTVRTVSPSVRSAPASMSPAVSARMSRARCGAPQYTRQAYRARSENAPEIFFCIVRTGVPGTGNLFI